MGLREWLVNRANARALAACEERYQALSVVLERDMRTAESVAEVLWEFLPQLFRLPAVNPAEQLAEARFDLEQKGCDGAQQLAELVLKAARRESRAPTSHALVLLSAWMQTIGLSLRGYSPAHDRARWFEFVLLDLHALTEAGRAASFECRRLRILNI